MAKKRHETATRDEWDDLYDRIQARAAEYEQLAYTAVPLQEFTPRVRARITAMYAERGLSPPEVIRFCWVTKNQRNIRLIPISLTVA